MKIAKKTRKKILEERITAWKSGRMSSKNRIVIRRFRKRILVSIRKMQSALETASDSDFPRVMMMQCNNIDWEQEQLELAIQEGVCQHLHAMYEGLMEYGLENADSMSDAEFAATLEQLDGLMDAQQFNGCSLG